MDLLFPSTILPQLGEMQVTDSRAAPCRKGAFREKELFDALQAEETILELKKKRERDREGVALQGCVLPSIWV